jgi:hypothetical protein
MMKVTTKITIVEKDIDEKLITGEAKKLYIDSVYDYLSYEFDGEQEIKIEVDVEAD